MSSIDKRTDGGRIRWVARYRTPEGGARKKTFARKVDAENFVTKLDAAMLTWSCVDPKQAARSFAEVAEEHWAAHEHLLAADTTRIVKRSRLDKHILPVLGRHPVGSIKPSAIAAAVAVWSQTLAPGTVGQTLRQIRQVMDAAVLDGIIASNPAKVIKAPTAPRRRDVHLSDADVAAILATAPDGYRSLVVALAGLGLRISEACGLRVEDIGFLRKTIKVRQQRRPGGDMGQLKTDASNREIPAVDAVLESLAEQIRIWPRRDGLIFSSVSGRQLTKAIAGHLFDDIEKITGTKASPHSLRHYFGLSLISGGTSVVAVSRWLGHSSPEITWRVYSYMMPSDEETGRAAMTKTMAKLVPVVSPTCPEGVVDAL